MLDKKDDDLKRVEAAIQTLVEHFDTVHIFTTRHEQGEEQGTLSVSLGAGNWYARYGQISYWLLKRRKDGCMDAEAEREEEE